MANMELLVLNSDFEIISVIDVLDSLIWTDRYSAYGDFEIYTPVTTELLSYLQQEYYLWLNGSDHIMIIEDIQIKCDTEEGNYLIVTGRSLESILDRRIIWEQTILSGNLQNGIETLLNDAIISPTITDRTIENFIFEPSTDTAITDLIIEAQIPRGLNLYEVIQQLCVEKNIGFKITLSNEDQFIFKLYTGVDRSYEQMINPYVVFSPNFDNLINADYTESKKTLKTVTVVAGEGEETARKTTVVGSGSSLTRRELYTDANDLSQNDGETVLTDEEYLAQLIQRGTDELSKYTVNKSFESQIDNITNLFKYNEDFFMGDVVQITSDYGIDSRVRVTEIIYSQSQEGIEIYPTLTVVDVGDVEADGVLIPGATHPASMITDLPTGKKVARFVVGTSTAGWTAADCDYLCDGMADQAEINAAITALPATGGEIVILDGTYNITAKINVTKDNVSIRGNGNATILKRMFNSTSAKEGVITLTSEKGCKIANLQIDGNKVSYTNVDNYGIYLHSSISNAVTGNICNNNYYGIYLYTSDNNIVTGNICNNNEYGIYLRYSGNTTFTGNICNNNNYGTILYSSSNATFAGNACNNNNYYGIYLHTSSNNIATGNICNNNECGIYLRSSSNTTITGNTCNNNNTGGIYLYFSSNNNTVTGNTGIRGTGTAGDYTTTQHTICLYGTDNSYNLIAMNNCMGKAVTNSGGTGNTLVNNKFDAS